MALPPGCEGSKGNPHHSRKDGKFSSEDDAGSKTAGKGDNWKGKYCKYQADGTPHDPCGRDKDKKHRQKCSGGEAWQEAQQLVEDAANVRDIVEEEVRTMLFRLTARLEMK